MRLIKGKFPPYACRRADFITGKVKVKPDERVINMQKNVEDLPMTGALCIHESTVRSMVELLGWQLADNIDAERLAYLELRVEEYETQLAQMKEILPA